jgi:nucleoside-diphosphate-sugar epimerase
MKVLVTGGAGYIGSVLSSTLLNHGHKVRVLDRLVYGGESLIPLLDDKNFQFVLGDVGEAQVAENCLTDVDYVIHLAALVGEAICNKYPDEAARTNTDATIGLYEQAARKRVKGFIFFSTCSNYGFNSSDEIASENAPLKPSSLYARSKVSAESHLMTNANGKVPVIIARLATGYGLSPRMRFDLLLSEFVRDGFQRRAVEVYGGSAWRPICHIKDHAEATILLLSTLPHQEHDVETYNLGSNEQNYTKLQIARIVAERLDVEIRVDPERKETRSYKVAFDKVAKLGFSPERNPGESVDRILSALQSGALRIRPEYDNVEGARL